MTVHSVAVHEFFLLIPEKDEWLIVKKNPEIKNPEMSN